MERRDYILREIEKIGLILTAIKQMLLGGKENLPITIDSQIEEAKEMLFHEINFDLDHFLDSDNEESGQYLSVFKGFDIENREQLADIIAQIGLNTPSSQSKKYLEKALQLYELCRLESKTYSLERENKITTIKSALQGL